MKYVQSDAHRFAPWGRHTGGKHMPVNDTANACIARSCYSRKRYFSRFPVKRVSVRTWRQAKGNKVGWNVIRLDDVIHVGIIKFSPTAQLKVQLAPSALCANAIPCDFS